MKKNIFKPYKSLNIKNIVFDLGGVVLDIDYQLTLDAYRSLGVTNLEKVYTLQSQTDIFNKLDCGTISVSNFIDEVRNLVGLPLTNEQIIWAWNALLLPWDMERINLLEKLKQSYNLYLLSNTNQIHFDVYNPQLMQLTDGKQLSDFFIKAYYSFKIKMRKPNTEIFQYVLNDSKLNPAETLFIDDSIDNIRAASRLGIVTYNLKANSENILQLFE